MPFNKLKRQIILVPYDPEWNILFNQEKKTIFEILSENSVKIEHFGSTSIGGILSKPTIDIAIGFMNTSEIQPSIDLLKSMDYFYIPEFSLYLENRQFLWKGTKDNHKFHLHLMGIDTPDWTNIVLFRDFLRINKSVAGEYEKLKINLSEKYPDNIELYVKGKENFLQEILLKAKALIVK